MDRRYRVAIAIHTGFNSARIAQRTACHRRIVGAVYGDQQRLLNRAARAIGNHNDKGFREVGCLVERLHRAIAIVNGVAV